MHGCSGLEKYSKRGLNNHPQFLNQHGFATVIIDSFGSRASKDYCPNNELLAKARYFRTFDAFNTLEFLGQQSYVDRKNIFLVGQSNGGSVAIIVAGGGASFGFASDLKYRGVIAYYPWCGMYIDELVSPLLVFGAGKDDWVIPDGCQNQQETVKGEALNVVIYPEAQHSFDLPMRQYNVAGHTVAGHIPSTQDSREKMLKFFKDHLDLQN